MNISVWEFWATYPWWITVPTTVAFLVIVVGISDIIVHWIDNA